MAAKIYQVFYDRPYKPFTILAILIFINVFYFFLYQELGPRDSEICPQLIPLALCIGSHLGVMIGICLVAIVLDTEAVYWWSKRVVGGADDREYGGDVREVTVKKPFIGFGNKEIRVEPPEGAGGVWLDRFMYEEAIIRITRAVWLFSCSLLSGLGCCWVVGVDWC